MKCSKCSKDKAADKFPTKNKRLGLKHKQCKDCVLAYHRAYYKSNPDKQLARSRRWHKQRRRWLDEYKKNRSCMDCDNFFHPCQMDFDHVDPTKKSFTVSNALRTTSKKRVLEEIAKCDLVCANCHRLRTHVPDLPLSSNDKTPVS